MTDPLSSVVEALPEQEICREVFAHPDAAEGPLAFLEKREPRFSDQ